MNTVIASFFLATMLALPCLCQESRFGGTNRTLRGASHALACPSEEPCARVLRRMQVFGFHGGTGCCASADPSRPTSLAVNVEGIAAAVDEAARGCIARPDSVAPVRMPMVVSAPLEPDDGLVYHGVGQSNTGVHEYVSAMADSTIMPIVVNFYYDIPGTRGNRFAELRQRFAEEKSIGRIPHLSIAMTNGREWTDSAIATSARYDDVIDSLAQIIADYGGRLFVRPGFEFGGTWFPYHPYLYPRAFQKIVDRFRAVHDRDSMAFLWCYYPAAPNDFDSVNGRGEYKWYPGDDFVDWYSLDLFKAGDFHPDSTDSRRGQLTPKGKSERFLSMARARGKPVFLSEVSAAYTNITPDSVDGIADWEAWFVPFLQFVRDHPEIKGFNYTNWNWSDFSQWQEWGDARIEVNMQILQRYRAEMREPRYIHLRTRSSAIEVEPNAQRARRCDRPDLSMTQTPIPASASTARWVAGRQ